MKLYSASSILPREDYSALLEIARGHYSVLEFGPGISTFAFIEAGAQVIDSYEHAEKWRRDARLKFREYPQVRIFSYENIPYLLGPDRRYNIAFVDSPSGGKNSSRIIHPGQDGLSRYNTLKYALDRSDIVLLHDADREDEQNSIKALGCNYVMLTDKLARLYK